MYTPSSHSKPTIGQLFLTWTMIGLQSFGGGASTNFLIQREFIEKHQWITMEEYTHFMALCFFTPGINLVALAILIGKKLGGNLGIFVSVMGMLVPSALVTCLLTVGFKQVEQLSSVQAIMKGIIPATAGIMLIVGLKFAQPQLLRARKEGVFSLCATAILILGCALTIILFKAPVAIMLPAIALLGVLCFTRPLFQRQKGEKNID